MVFVASLVAVLRERPSPKHFGPLLLVWGLAMLMLIFIRDLGTSLMFFGGFLALLYVATARLSLVGVGATMFLGGAVYFANHVPHVQDRVHIWPTPSRGQSALSEHRPGDGVRQLPGLPDRPVPVRAGGRGLFGQGFGQALLESPGGGTLLPAPHTDLIYAVIVNEVGLFGAAGLIAVYLLFAYRGFKTADARHDGFSKLLAAGLTAVFALQVFVIVGGVTRVIPLTGVTLPFVSYGGSSIVANLVLLALLLIVSDRARAERIRRGRAGVNRQIAQLFALTVVLFAVLVGFTSYWSVFDAEGLEDELAEPARADRGAAGPARADPRARRPHAAGAERAARARRETHVRAHLSRRAAVRPRRGLLVHQNGAAVRAVRQRRPRRPGGRVRVDPLRAGEQEREGDGPGHQPRSGRRSRPPTRRSAGARARSSRSSRRPARCS